MIRYIKYLMVLVLGIAALSCTRKTGELGDKLPKKKDAELISAMDSISGISYQYFYSKVSTTYEDSSQNVSFKTSIRIVSDSASQFLITYARIPVLNAMITTDSVHITDKREKCYVSESLDFIKNQFGVEFELKDIERLLMGLPVGFNQEEKYFQVPSSEGYTLCTHNKRELKKVDKGALKELVMYYTLTPDLNSLLSTTVVSPEDSTEIYINYESRELVGNALLPQDVSIRILTPKQELKIFMEYRKTRVNEREEIYFVIPEGYEECE